MRISSYQTICICGGGSLGHALAVTIGSKGCRVNMLSGKPEQWQKNMTAYDCNGHRIACTLNRVSGNAEEVIPEADVVLLCVPGYLIESTVRKIKPFLKVGQLVGSVVCSNGFFWIARSILGDQIPLFGFQRVPFICRVKEYGKSVDIKGYKSQLKIGGLTNSDELKELALFFTEVLDTRTTTLNHFLEATLTNSNPILHPARIYAMLSAEEKDCFEKEILFYEEWDNKSSEVLIACDQEFQAILSKLPVSRDEIPPLLAYYDSHDASSLTQKIHSIGAFKGIKMSMVKTEKGFQIDYSNRYFTEDIPYGLLIIKSFGILTNTPTPTIDDIILWIQPKIGKEYLIGGEITGKDIRDSGVIQNFGINTIKTLVELI